MMSIIEEVKSTLKISKYSTLLGNIGKNPTNKEMTLARTSHQELLRLMSMYVFVM